MSCLTAPLRRIASRLGSLPTDTSGLAYIEFAYMLPILMALGLGGIELANLSLTHTRVSQIALSLADNSSRAKQDVVTGLPRLRETDINQILTASQLQGGDLDMTENGRLILSSLEVNAEGGQWIHWQRCIGDKDHDSTYGVQDDGTTGTGFPGMGPASRRIVAEDGFAVMFAEVAYDYQPIMTGGWFPDYEIIKTAAFYVRDDRDLSQVYNPAPAAPVNNCG